MILVLIQWFSDRGAVSEQSFRVVRSRAEESVSGEQY